MAFNINQFTGAMKFGGARSSLFSIFISNPVNSAADITVPLLARAAQIPASSITPVETHYFGRVVKFAGNRTYPEWTVTIINDEDLSIRNALEEWSHAINTPQGNLRRFSAASPALYKSDAQVTQYSKTGVPLRTYNFVGMWPSEIASIDLSFDAEGIQEFTTTFTFDYWYVLPGVTGSAGGQ